MQNASVLIDGSVMRKACGDEKTAKWLEENLAIMPDVIRNAQKAAISHGHVTVAKPTQPQSSTQYLAHWWHIYSPDKARTYPYAVDPLRL